MIIRQNNSPRVVFQTPDDADSIAEPAIAASRDANGLIILNQEGRDLIINRASVPELVRVLRELGNAKG